MHSFTLTASSTQRTRKRRNSENRDNLSNSFPKDCFENFHLRIESFPCVSNGLENEKIQAWKIHLPAAVAS